MSTITSSSTTNTRSTVATYFTYDHFNHKIVGSELNFKKSGIPGSAQYNALMEAMGAHPTYSLAPIAPEFKKQTYKGLSSGCTCPRDFPVCVCGNKPSIKEITKKPILPSEEELTVNPRSRSAKLRVAEKI